jgi:DNA-binding NarL/FixJ family response regulator
MDRIQNVKILLVDDQKLMRDILGALIEDQPGMRVVGEAENGRNALELTAQLRPDVVVMDIHMPDLNGIDATRRIVAEFPDTKVIALSMHSDKQFVDAMLKAGASGYLLKDRSYEEVVRAIRSVVTHHIYLCSEVDCSVAKDFRKNTYRKNLPPLPT